MKNVKSNQATSVAITELEQLDLSYVAGATGTGHVSTASGDCTQSGRSCGEVRGMWDQLCEWVLPR